MSLGIDSPMGDATRSGIEDLGIVIPSNMHNTRHVYGLDDTLVNL
jgi:hypothetical protein